MAAKGKEYRDPELARKVVTAYRRGMKVVDIVERYGVPKSTIYTWVKANRVGPGGKGRAAKKYTRAVKDQIATLNYRGMSDSEIARRLGLEQQWVRIERKRMGLPSFMDMKGNG